MTWLPWLRALFAGGVGLGVVFGVRALIAGHHASSLGDPAPRAAIPVVTAAVDVVDLPIVVTVLGRVAAAPSARVVISSRAGGLVTDVLVRPGSHVDPGATLLRIDRAPLEAAVALAQAAATAADSNRLVAARAGREQRLGELVAAVDDARATLALCTDRIARLEPLIRDQLVATSRGEEAAAELAAAQRKLDVAERARAGFVAAVAELERGALDSASAAALLALDEAKRALADADVEAPIAGELVELQVGVGDRPAPGAPLGAIVAQDGREVRFEVNPTIAARIKPGARATWTSAAGEAAHGTVRCVLGQIDPATGMAAILVDPAAGANGDAPGLTVAGELEVDRMCDALTVPEAALVRSDDRPAVVVAAGGIAKHVAVRVLARHHGRVAVAGELPAGARVIVEGAFALAEGAAVRETPGAAVGFTGRN